MIITNTSLNNIFRVLILFIFTFSILGNIHSTNQQNTKQAEQYQSLKEVRLNTNIVKLTNKSGKSIEKNILTQEMLNQNNTRYVIQYDYDLNSAEITIPEGSILDFQGGCLNNGTIIFNNTKLLGNINIGCRYSGIIKNNEISLEWFTGDDNNIIQDAINASYIYRPTTTLYGASVQTIKLKSKHHYKISTTLIFNQFLVIRGNDAIIEQTNKGIPIFKSNQAFHVDISDINFIGNNTTIFYIDAPNYDAAKFKFNNIHIDTDNHDTTIKNNYAFYISSRSGVLFLNDIKCTNAPQFLKSSLDFVYLTNSWINGYRKSTGVKPGNTCSINNDGTSRMTISHCVFIPEFDGYKAEKDTRWIDNYAHLSIQDSHFGGENAGFPIIWQYNSPDKLSNLAQHKCQIDISNTQCSAGGYYKYWGGIIVLMKDVLPGSFSLKNTQVSVDTKVISLYGWVKNAKKEFSNIEDVYNEAKLLYCERINTSIQSNTYYPKHTINICGNTPKIDKVFFNYIGKSSSNFPTTVNKSINFAKIHRWGHHAKSYQFSEFKFRVDINGTYKSGYIFSKSITYTVKCHMYAGNKPKIIIIKEDESYYNQWENGLPINSIDPIMEANIIDINNINLSMKVQSEIKDNNLWNYISCGISLISTVESYSSTNTLPELFFYSIPD